MAEAPIIRDFVGLNKYKPETNLAPNEASVAENVIFSNQRIEKRKGSSRLTPYVCPKPSLGFDGSQWAESLHPIYATVYSQYAYLHLTDHTMEVTGWLNSGNSTQTHVLAQRGWVDSGGVAGWGLWFDESDKTFRYYEPQNGAGSDIETVGTYTNYAAQKPFHLAVVREGTVTRMWLKDEQFEGEIGKQTGLLADAREKWETTYDYKILFGTGGHWSDDTLVRNYSGRLQEFRTWNYVRSTASLSTFALKELTTHERATDNLKHYYKFNEGSGHLAYDYGYITRVVASTVTNALACVRMPSSPTWVDGLVTGGVADKAVRLDGLDDVVGIPYASAYSIFGTSSTEWSVQFIAKPHDQIANDSTFLMHGRSTWHTNSTGYAFRVWASVDRTTGSQQFVANFGFDTGTYQITWGTTFTASTRYGITIQRAYDEVRLRVDDLTNEVSGSFSTAAVGGNNLSPDFGAGFPVLAGASWSDTSPVPTAGYAAFDIDEIRLWNGLRYEALNVQIPHPHDPQLMGYYKCNDGSGLFLSDSSATRNYGFLVPAYTPPGWSAGWVEPIEGPEITGIFYYQNNIGLVDQNDARERALLITTENSIYRNEGGQWQALESGRVSDALHCGEQLGTQMAIVNGFDANRMFDGNALWNLGLDAPIEAATTSVFISSGLLWDANTLNQCMGDSLLTCHDSDRTELNGTFNNKRVQHNIGGSTGTIETRCQYFYGSQLYTNVAANVTQLTSSFVISVFHKDWVFQTQTGAVPLVPGDAPVPFGGLEGGKIGVYLSPLGTWTASATITFGIKKDDSFGGGGVGWHRYLTTYTTITGKTYHASGHSHQVALAGHFIWTATATHSVLSTSTYDINLVDSKVSGHFFYRHSNYNKFTGIESNPSPPTDERASPSDQWVAMTVDTTTDTSVTDRLIYRTLQDGAQRGDDYFLVGTASGTGQVAWIDNTPAGDEGRLISFFRGKPPKSLVCKVFKGRMWYVPVEYPNRVYYSAVLKPAEVDDWNYLLFGDETEHITGIGIHYDNLVIFKRRSTWVASRSDVPIGMRPTRINNSVGCVSHHTIQECNGELVFLGEDGVYSLRGSDIRKISGTKVQHYIDRIDPSYMHRAVATQIRRDSIYRLNITPHANYAGSDRTAKNSWYLDYFYQASRDHTPFFEPIWAFGRREVSFYGDYVDQNNWMWESYGNYRGVVALDNAVSNYTEGLGWYRGSSVGASLADPNAAASAGDYTVTVDATLFTDGHGLKALPIRFIGAGTDETHICYKNTASDIVLQTPLAAALPSTAHVFVAPINAKYKTGWTDFGSTMADKMGKFIKVDHNLESAESTMTLVVTGDRSTTGRGQHYDTHTLHLNVLNEKVGARVRGKHIQVEFQHYWPGETFAIWNWSLQVEGGRPR